MKNLAIPFRAALIGSIMLCLANVGVAWGQEEVSKTVEERFPLSNSGTLKLENKYGNLSLTGWEKDEVYIKSSIKVNHRKREHANDLLSRIRLDIKPSKEYIAVESRITNKNTGWFADFFNRNNPIDMDRSHVQIDYEVFLPRKASLQITNRFGDVLIEDWNGELNALVEHGDLWISEDLNKADVILKFGKLRAQNLSYATINLKNGELDMGNAQSLRLQGNGSEMKLDSIQALEIYSNKDAIDLAHATTIYGSLKFSSLNLAQLGEGADMSMKIADFRAEAIGSPKAEIAIEQESSDINIAVNGFSHHFEATIEQGIVRLPKSFENVRSDMLDKGKKLRTIKATYGAGKEGSITIQGVKGIVTLRE